MNSICLSLLIVTFIFQSNRSNSTPLDDYVHKPDSMFGWKKLDTHVTLTHTVHVLNLTSQKWIDDSFSSRSIWWHHLIIIVPKLLQRSKTAFLLVDAGTNNDPTPNDSKLSSFVINTQSIGAVVRQVPNQPIRFWADSSNRYRSEDAVISWTWKKYLDMNASDPNILLQLPMTKAVVRAMDAIQQFLLEEHITVPEKFILSGSSKRGWASWLTAAVNPTRVSAIIPVVMDLLNIYPNMMSHYRSLHGWSFALRDYYESNITRFIDNPMLLKIAAITDPYVYFSRYKDVKIYQGQATGDQFFLIDSEDYFWNNLQIATGGSYLRRIPNADHSLLGIDDSLISFYISVSDKNQLPSFRWIRTINQTHGTIRAFVDFSSQKPKPIYVMAYQTRTNDNLRRDFRANKLDLSTGRVIYNSLHWSNTSVWLENQNNTTATYSIVVPITSNRYWTATFIQMQFPVNNGGILTLTTETLILPDTYPVDQCHDQQCYGQLV